MGLLAVKVDPSAALFPHRHVNRHLLEPCMVALCSKMVSRGENIAEDVEESAGWIWNPVLESVNANSVYMGKWHATQKSTQLTRFYMKRKSYVEMAKLKLVDGSCHVLLEMGRGIHRDLLGRLPRMVG